MGDDRQNPGGYVLRYTAPGRRQYRDALRYCREHALHAKVQVSRQRVLRVPVRVVATIDVYGTKTDLHAYVRWHNQAFPKAHLVADLRRANDRPTLG